MYYIFTWRIFQMKSRICQLKRKHIGIYSEQNAASAES